MWKYVIARQISIIWTCATLVLIFLFNLENNQGKWGVKICVFVSESVAILCFVLERKGCRCQVKSRCAVKHMCLLGNYILVTYGVKIVSSFKLHQNSVVQCTIIYLLFERLWFISYFEGRKYSCNLFYDIFTSLSLFVLYVCFLQSRELVC